MALPDFSMRQLLEAGVHFGHQTHRWNPKMGQYIFGVRNNIHIIDLSQTVPLLDQALKVVSDTVSGGGRVLFVGTKRQASEIVADAAKRSAQYYVNFRWLGGTLTNWKTISNSIRRLRNLEELLAGEAEGFTKKERLNLTRERDKLDRALGGIKDMGSTPDLMFVIDTNKEAIAIQEAKRLGIPVVAVVDSNCDPDMIDHPIPGNDDAARAISLYCDLIAKAAIDGIARQQGALGIDVGEQAEVPTETAIKETGSSAEEPAEKKPAEKKPAAEKPAEKKAVEDKPAEPVSEDKPAEEKPAEAASEEKPAEPVSEEKPAEEKPAEAASEEKPAKPAAKKNTGKAEAEEAAPAVEDEAAGEAKKEV